MLNQKYQHVMKYSLDETVLEKEMTMPSASIQYVSMFKDLG